LKEGPFSSDVAPDWEAFLACTRREGTPARVHHIELSIDPEVEDAIAARYGVLDGLDPEDPFFGEKRHLRLQRFLGYDYVHCGVENQEMVFTKGTVEDSTELARDGGRRYMEEHAGPITSWTEFEAYPWPDVKDISTRGLEWYEANLPDDMCVVGGAGAFGHFAEHLSWLMGYETLCYALYEQRDLVEAITAKNVEMFEAAAKAMLKFDRVRILFASDDMGFRSGTLISPDDLREFVLPGHKRLAALAHDAGRPYLLHSCGNLDGVMDDLIDDVGIDGKHSFEDAIEPVAEFKTRYGDRIAVLGGIDVDLLGRADATTIRARVRETLEQCMPGGGYCLGSGNSIANYVPVDGYLAMLDEGRRYGA
jgi:uroporphyrinogen decarboxylase